ncbi:DUF2283 domain-containing protein [Sphaerisporangium fuscum]|uniref:DUF2283 domain-containing protein n=1 Tax=Sphaerisporangium fuscum TaxID=2835868 RepID=UPI001BDC0AB3|nr:DUF2283 domain-containing protein [Sphaerisporangium fuscum]
MSRPKVRWDREVNAAYIAFRELDANEASKKLPVEDENGETHLLVRISESGELLGIELLMADEQMPRNLREDSETE